jgi:restriction system protein
MMRGMSPSDFEEFVAKMFSALNYRTRLTGGSGDGGIDIAMMKDGRHYIVQCKKFITRKVNPHDVRDFYGAMGDQHIDGKGFFITTNIFTLEAENFAEGKPIELIDGTRLIELVRQSGVLGQQMNPQNTTSDLKTERCPNCGADLVVRTNSSNGNRFLGCSHYPNCKFTKPLS